MSRFTAPQPAGKPANNIYTALLFIALVALGVAAGFLWKHNLDETGEFQKEGGTFKNPFHLVEQPN